MRSAAELVGCCTLCDDVRIAEVRSISALLGAEVRSQGKPVVRHVYVRVAEEEEPDGTVLDSVHDQSDRRQNCRSKKQKKKKKYFKEQNRVIPEQPSNS